MLKKPIYFMIGSLLLIIVSCTPKGENKTTRPVISKNIEYDVTINNFKMFSQWGLAASTSLWYRNNMESSVRNEFLTLLFNKAKAGKLELYDMNDKRIDTNGLKEILSVMDTMTLARTSPPYKSYDTVVNNIIQPEEITALRFREEWSYDPATMALMKKVLAFAPIRTLIKYDKDGKEIYGKDKPLFWVKWSKEPANTKVLTHRIFYHVKYIGSEDFEKATFIDSIAIQKYMKLFLDKAYKDSITAYDITSGPDFPTVPISGKDLYKTMNRVDTIKQKDTKSSQHTSVTVIKHEANATTIRFIEEWSFDPITMAIEKKVVGICPVEKCYEADGVTFKGYRPYFWVYFGDVWTPFDGKLELQKKK
jgi:hypothetical protein